MDFYNQDKRSAIQSISDAQRIAFAPVVFQVARIMRDKGFLALLNVNIQGLSLQELSDKTGVSFYGTRVLLEASLGIGLVTQNESDLYQITKTGWFILHDEITRVNMDFVHDVCYKGLFDLDKSIENGKPEGLKVHGEWNTIYEALSILPERVQKSWFSFDHYYSDQTFTEALPIVFESRPKTLLDIGGNTGKWAKRCLEYDQDVQITIMDLSGQVGIANANLNEAVAKSRLKFFVTDVLDISKPFPTEKFDAIWMSQFLDCFSDSEIVSILERAKMNLTENGKIYIIEPFWDRQRFEAGAFSLQQTSVYFTCIANGNSQMYHSKNFIGLIEKAGLVVNKEFDELGVSNTLLVCSSK